MKFILLKIWCGYYNQNSITYITCKKKYFCFYQAVLKKLLVRYMHKLEDKDNEAVVTQNHLTQLKIDLMKEMHQLIPRQVGLCYVLEPVTETELLKEMH